MAPRTGATTVLPLSLSRSRAPASALRSAALCASSQRDADRHAAAAAGPTELTVRAHRAVGGPPLRPRRIYVEYTAFITARGTR
jgi:hypothetical protein